MHAPKPQAKVASKAVPSRSLADFLPYQLSIASNAVSARIAKQYQARFGLNVMEWRIMAVLGDAGAATQRELTQMTLMDKVPVNRACKTLEERGLAARRPNQSDGRSHLLELTEEGRAVHDRIMPLAEAIEGELFGALSEEDQKKLRDLLIAIREAAGDFDDAALS